MTDQFVAEIRIFPFNFPPTGWAFCDGQLIPISQNTALFSLVGTMYGGDGKSTFGLPNMQGNAAMFWGQGAGLSFHDEGESSGSTSVTLLNSELPQHNHSMESFFHAGTSSAPSPANAIAGSGANDTFTTDTTQSNIQQMNPLSIGITGGSQPHNNMMPSLTLNYCIAMQGIYPQRS